MWSISLHCPVRVFVTNPCASSAEGHSGIVSLRALTENTLRPEIRTPRQYGNKPQARLVSRRVLKEQAVSAVAQGLEEGREEAQPGSLPAGTPHTLSFALWLPDERLGSADLQVMCQGF